LSDVVPLQICPQATYTADSSVKNLIFLSLFPKVKDLIERHNCLKSIGDYKVMIIYICKEILCSLHCIGRLTLDANDKRNHNFAVSKKNSYCFITVLNH